MSFWQKALGNLGTTFAGIIAAAATYTVSVGGKMPETKNEWAMAAASIALAAMGILAKDATTGSAPGAKQ